MAKPMPIGERLHDDRVFSRLLSRGEYNPSKQGDASFRVLYYAGATGSVPFLWESQPGTPKHKLSDDILPPLTPPPQYQSSLRASQKNHSKNSNFFNSVFQRVPSRKITNASLLLLSPPSSSSSHSLPSTPFHTRRSNSKAHSGPIVHFGLDEVEYGPGRNSPTSTLCFGPRSASPSRKVKAIKGVKKVMKSIVGRGSF